MDIMKDEINIVKELPPDLKSLDIEAIGSLVCATVLVYTLFCMIKVNFLEKFFVSLITYFSRLLILIL